MGMYFHMKVFRKAKLSEMPFENYSAVPDAWALQAGTYIALAYRRFAHMAPSCALHQPCIEIGSDPEM